VSRHADAKPPDALSSESFPDTTVEAVPGPKSGRGSFQPRRVVPCFETRIVRDSPGVANALPSVALQSHVLATPSPSGSFGDAFGTTR